MPDDLRHFLVTRRFGKLDSILVFDDADEALRAYEDKERENGWINNPLLDETVECVLLGAERLSTCISTHGNWFDEPNRLLEALEVDERTRAQLPSVDLLDA